MPRNRARPKRGTGVPNLVLRDGVYYYARQHRELGRIFKSLSASDGNGGMALALERHAAINTIIERGDYGTVRRWIAGEVDIATIASVVRSGGFGALAAIGIEGPRLGAEVDAYMRRTLGTRTRRTYDQTMAVLGPLVLEWGADTLMSGVTTAQCELYLHAPKRTNAGKTWAPNTQRAARVRCKAVWDMTLEREAEAADIAGRDPLITRNPWRKARVPKSRKTRHSYLTEEEGRNLMLHPYVAGTAQEAYLAVGMYAGLRPAEIIHLRTDIDVVLDASHPRIRVQDRDGEFAWITKTPNSIRDVPIVPALREILLRHRERFAGPRYFFRTPGADKPMAALTGREWCRRCFVAAGLRYGREGESLTLHSMRHTFATWLVAAGVPIPTVAEWMGDTPEMVLSTYAHHMPRASDAVHVVLQAAAMGQHVTPVAMAQQ